MPVPGRCWSGWRDGGEDPFELVDAFGEDLELLREAAAVCGTAAGRGAVGSQVHGVEGGGEGV